MVESRIEDKTLTQRPALMSAGPDPVDSHQPGRVRRRKPAGWFEGFVDWYVEVVKPDLEAKMVIERVPKMSPQLYRLVEGRTPRDTTGRAK